MFRCTYTQRLCHCEEPSATKHLLRDTCQVEKTSPLSARRLERLVARTCLLSWSVFDVPITRFAPDTSMIGCSASTAPSIYLDLDRRDGSPRGGAMNGRRCIEFPDPIRCRSALRPHPPVGRTRKYSVPCRVHLNLMTISWLPKGSSVTRAHGIGGQATSRIMAQTALQSISWFYQLRPGVAV